MNLTNFFLLKFKSTKLLRVFYRLGTIKKSMENIKTINFIKTNSIIKNATILELLFLAVS